MVVVESGDGRQSWRVSRASPVLCRVGVALKSRKGIATTTTTTTAEEHFYVAGQTLKREGRKEISPGSSVPNYMQGYVPAEKRRRLSRERVERRCRLSISSMERGGVPPNGRNSPPPLFFLFLCWPCLYVCTYEERERTEPSSSPFPNSVSSPTRSSLKCNVCMKCRAVRVIYGTAPRVTSVGRRSEKKRPNSGNPVQNPKKSLGSLGPTVPLGMPMPTYEGVYTSPRTGDLGCASKVASKATLSPRALYERLLGDILPRPLSVQTQKPLRNPPSTPPSEILISFSISN